MKVLMKILRMDGRIDMNETIKCNVAFYEDSIQYSTYFRPNVKTLMRMLCRVPRNSAQERCCVTPRIR
eukprot:g35213.t1